MKRLLLILISILICGLISGCRCAHEWRAANCCDPETCQWCGIRRGEAAGHDWQAAACGTPKTCEFCGATEGTAPSHHWLDATCTAPKTCSVCSATEGEPLGHIWVGGTCEAPEICKICGMVNSEAPGHNWTEATCTAAKTCEICGQTEGIPRGHKWSEATTTASKTCTVCGASEGSALQTDPRFQTDACKPLFGIWRSSRTVTAAELALSDLDGSFTEIRTVTFHHNGIMSVACQIEDADTCRALMKARIIQDTYASYAQKGMSKEETDLYFPQLFGMTVQEYAADYANTYIDTYLNQSAQQVYYVAGHTLYTAQRWADTMQTLDFIISGSTLILTGENGEVTELVRV